MVGVYFYGFQQYEIGQDNDEEVMITVELFSAEFFAALLSIVIIDLVLAGDNAVVIGLAARNVPKEMQKKVILLGTAGAIIIRAIATLFVVWLLKIPFLMLLGGLILIWIAYKLLVEEKHHDIAAAPTLFAAIKTIMIADLVMGLDNVLAIAGASHGDWTLVILGLLISIPIVVWGSTIILKFIDRFPIIVYIGSGVLAFTAAKMIINDDRVEGLFAGDPLLRWGLTFAIVAAVLVAGKLKKAKQLQTSN
jgi:YjbE family integral membrane protein